MPETSNRDKAYEVLTDLDDQLRDREGYAGAALRVRVDGSWEVVIGFVNEDDPWLVNGEFDGVRVVTECWGRVELE